VKKIYNLVLLCCNMKDIVIELVMMLLCL
jgi:hypothetical protein